MKVPVVIIFLFMLLACKSKFAGKPYIFRATETDGYAYRELRLYQDSTFEFLLDAKDTTETKLYTGRYFIKGDTLNLQYNTLQLNDRVYQMVIVGNGLYNPFVTDEKGMQIQFNNLPKAR